MKHYLAILLLSLSVSAHGTPNKWVDVEGNVHYSDAPPPANAKRQTLKLPSAPKGKTTQKSYVEREAEYKKAQKAKGEAEQKAAQQQENDLAKQRNCEGAKSNLATFQNNTPLTAYNDKGEKVMIDDTARQQRIEEARKQISMYCGE